MHDNVTDQTHIIYSHFMTTFTLMYDLDLEATDLFILHDTLSCYSDYFCKVLLKSFYAPQTDAQTDTQMDIKQSYSPQLVKD